MKKKFASLTLVLLLVFQLSFSVYAYPVYDYVNLDYQQQTYSYICWAACASVILDYFGHSVSQFTFDVVVKNGFENAGATDTEVREGFLYFEVGCSQIYSYLSYNSIKSQIYYNKPIYAGWSYYYPYYGGHALVIDGYDTTEGNYISYMDPADGAGYYVEYDWFKGGPAYYHIWDGTLYNLHND